MVRVNEQQQWDGGHGHEEQQQPNNDVMCYVKQEKEQGWKQHSENESGQEYNQISVFDKNKKNTKI